MAFNIESSETYVASYVIRNIETGVIADPGPMSLRNAYVRVREIAIAEALSAGKPVG